MRSTEQSGDGAKRFRAPPSGAQQGWLRTTAIRLLTRLLARLTVQPADSQSALIETMPFGVACWSAEAQLIASNDRFAERLGVAPSMLPIGAAYHEVVKALSMGGYMQSVREDTQNRLLELHREDGSTLLIEERPLATSGFVTLVMDVTESRRTDQLAHLDPRRTAPARPPLSRGKAPRRGGQPRPRPAFSPISATTSAPRSTTSSALPT